MKGLLQMELWRIRPWTPEHPSREMIMCRELGGDGGRERERECVCVPRWGRERERECVCVSQGERECVCVCVCVPRGERESVCVCPTERERERV